MRSKELTIIKEEQAKFNSINSSIVSVKVTAPYLLSFAVSLVLLAEDFVFCYAMSPASSPFWGAGGGGSYSLITIPCK